MNILEARIFTAIHVGLTSQFVCVCVAECVCFCVGWNLFGIWIIIPPPPKNINKYNMHVWPKKAIRPYLCPCQLCASVHVAAYFEFMHPSFAGKASSEQFTTEMTVYTVKLFHTRCRLAYHYCSFALLLPSSPLWALSDIHIAWEYCWLLVAQTYRRAGIQSLTKKYMCRMHARTPQHSL